MCSILTYVAFTFRPYGYVFIYPRVSLFPPSIYSNSLHLHNGPISEREGFNLIAQPTRNSSKFHSCHTHRTTFKKEIHVEECSFLSYVLSIRMKVGLSNNNSNIKGVTVHINNSLTNCCELVAFSSEILSIHWFITILCGQWLHNAIQYILCSPKGISYYFPLQGHTLFVFLWDYHVILCHGYDACARRALIRRIAIMGILSFVHLYRV